MWYNFKVEWIRYWQEMLHYKLNLFFANIGLLTLFTGLLQYMNNVDKEIIFILLIVWYSATHGFMNITFIIEEEIMDGTLIHIIGTKVSFLKVIFLRCSIQMVYDFLKSGIIFTLLFLISNLNFSKFSGISFLYIILLTLLSIFISYAIGLIVGTMTINLKKFSAFTNLLYYFVLFFGGILYDVKSSVIMNYISYLFPFMPFRYFLYGLQNDNIEIIYIIILLLQFVVYSIIGLILYKIIMKQNLKSGRIFYV